MAKKRNSRKGRAGRSGADGLHFAQIVKTFLAVCVVGGVVLGIVHWDKIMKRDSSGSESEDTVSLEIKAVPAWVNEALKEKLSLAARADGLGLQLDETAARRVQHNIETLFPWLAETTVRTLHDRLVIEGKWRMPVVFVKRGLDKFYVDRDLVVLDFVELPHLTITPVKDLKVMAKGPELGEVWEREDLAAAVELVELLRRWDSEKTPDKPLLDEIKAVDVSNYDGWENKRFPHIVLYATDDTEIIWGAALGKWQRNLEATDAEKLAKLYAYYKEYGTLLGEVKYINLRDPQDRINLPIDNY